MYKRLKRAVSGLLVLTVLFSMTLMTAEAKEIKDKNIDDEIIHVEFTYITMFKNNFDISDSGKSSVATTLSSYNVDEVHLYGYLQQFTNGNWKTIKTWSSEASGISDGFSGSWYVASGYSYRYKSYAFLYIDGSLVESTSDISNAIYY
jgi:membrane-bound lytic murein transglycosylase MltF